LLNNQQHQISKLTVKKKIEISGNINIKEDTIIDNTYKFADKHIIKIDGQSLDFGFAIGTHDYVGVDDSLISISMTIKTSLSDTASKVLDIHLSSKTDTIKDNLNGSKTYVNEPNSPVESIKLGDVFYNHITSAAMVDGPKGFIKAEANSSEGSTNTNELSKTLNIEEI
jgi:hypothetical protein